jgi:Uncharacterized membrane protein (homolog of Drosophila rhomboid)
MQYNSSNGGFGGSLFANIPPVTRNLFFINVLMFVATMINDNFMIGTFSMFYPASPFFRIWQPVTYMFMHGGFGHIFVNMWGLLMFGTALERTIGSKKYIILYFLAGFGALLLHCGIQFIEVNSLAAKMAQGIATAQSSYADILRTPMLGASGALYGVQVAYAMLYPNDVWTLVFPPVSLKAKWFIAIFIGIELITGVTGTVGGVAHFAHLGGALVGFLLILYWKKSGKLWR